MVRQNSLSNQFVSFVTIYSFLSSTKPDPFYF